MLTCAIISVQIDSHNKKERQKKSDYWLLGKGGQKRFHLPGGVWRRDSEREGQGEKKRGEKKSTYL